MQKCPNQRWNRHGYSGKEQFSKKIRLWPRRVAPIQLRNLSHVRTRTCPETLQIFSQKVRLWRKKSGYLILLLGCIALDCDCGLCHICLLGLAVHARCCPDVAARNECWCAQAQLRDLGGSCFPITACKGSATGSWGRLLPDCGVPGFSYGILGCACRLQGLRYIIRTRWRSRSLTHTRC